MINKLKTGLEFYNLSSTATQQAQLIDFLVTLEKWNKVHNLTAISNIDEMLTRHVLDSLSVAAFLPATGHILDVGTGAGLPGVPLAIMRPELSFVLLDSVMKKTSFVQQAITLLGLTNIIVVHARVENYQTTKPFNVIISRAFAKVGEFITCSAHLSHEDGFFIAMKGKVSQVQTETLPAGYLLTKIEAVQVPGQLGERCLAFVSKKTNRS